MCAFHWPQRCAAALDRHSWTACDRKLQCCQTTPRCSASTRHVVPWHVSWSPRDTRARTCLIGYTLVHSACACPNSDAQYNVVLDTEDSPCAMRCRCNRAPRNWQCTATPHSIRNNCTSVNIETRCYKSDARERAEHEQRHTEREGQGIEVRHDR